MLSPSDLDERDSPAVRRWSQPFFCGAPPEADTSVIGAM
jgi:hypothetical protein